MSAKRMINHCGAQLATFEELAAVPLPQTQEHMKGKISERYAAVPHGMMVGVTRTLIKELIGPKAIMSEKFSLSGGAKYPGARMFGMINLDLNLSQHEVSDVLALQRVNEEILREELASEALEQMMQPGAPAHHEPLEDDGIEDVEIVDVKGFNEPVPSTEERMLQMADEINPALVFRNSYDASMSLSYGLGYRVFICDNLAISSDILYNRKHIGVNVIRDTMGMVAKLVGTVFEQHEFDVDCRESMRALEMTQDRGFEVLGKMIGHGAIDLRNGTQSQAAIAIKEWTKPSFAVFEPRNLWSLANAITFAQATAPIGRRMESGINATDCLLGMLGEKYVSKAAQIRASYRKA